MHIDGIEIICDADVERALRQMFHRAANDLALSNKAVEKFEETVQADVVLVKKGKKPSTVIGARLYIITLLTGEARTQRKVAWASKSCEQSIRETYHLMTGRGKASVHGP